MSHQFILQASFFACGWCKQAHHPWLFVSNTHILSSVSSRSSVLTVSPPVVMVSCPGLVAPVRVWSGTCCHKNNLWSASRSTHLHLWVHTVWTCASTTTEHFIFTFCPFSRIALIGLTLFLLILLMSGHNWQSKWVHAGQSTAPDRRVTDDARYPEAAELCCVPAVLKLRLALGLCTGGRVRWIQRSGYLITSLLLPSSAPWTKGSSITLCFMSEVTVWHHTHLQLLQGSGRHVGILEVDEGAETLVKNSDAFYLTKPAIVGTQSL